MWRLSSRRHSVEALAAAAGAAGLPVPPGGRGSTMLMLVGTMQRLSTTAAAAPLAFLMPQKGARLLREAQPSTGSRGSAAMHTAGYGRAPAVGRRMQMLRLWRPRDPLPRAQMGSTSRASSTSA